MFGGLQQRPTRPQRHVPPTIPYLRDVPGTKADSFGHVAPYAASQYRHRLMLYHQRKQEFSDKRDLKEKAQLTADKIEMKYMKHFQKHTFKRLLHVKVEKKLEEYRLGVEVRREKLRELMWKEEREQIQEVIDSAQKVQESSLQEMKIRASELRNRRENERLEFVREKKFEQYIEKCDDFRPLINQKRLVETKQVQLVQIQENEMRKEKEREMNRMWHGLILKQVEAVTDREKQTEANKQKYIAENKAIWDLQCKAVQLKKEEHAKQVKEEGIYLDNLREAIIREEVAALDAKRHKRNELYKDIIEQIQLREDFLKREIEEELKCVNAYTKLQLDEAEKEKRLSEKEAMKHEMLQYQDYVIRLDQERKEEALRLEKLIQEQMKEIQKKQDEARCKFEIARRALLKNVLRERKEQQEFRRQEAEQRLKIQQAENEMNQLMFEQTQRMFAEYNRQKFVAEKQYKSDLKKQIEFSEMKKKREKEGLERQLKAGQAEEAKFREILAKVLNNETVLTEVHPFRQAINREKCPCPKNLY